MPNSPLRVGLLWHSPNSGNLGVGALTVGNLAIARQAARGLGLEPRFTIVGSKDDRPSYVQDADVAFFPVTGRTLLSPGGLWSAFGRQDCVLDIGGGDSFTDIYGLKRFFYQWTTKMQVVGRGVPLVLSPQTLGPFDKAVSRRLARLPIEAAAAVLTRDEPSLRALAEVSPKTKGTLAVDVAFALPYEDRSALRGGTRLRVGLNVSGLLFREAEAGSNRFGLEYDYAAVCRALLTELTARPDVEVHLVCHVIDPVQPVDDDWVVAEGLARAYPNAVLAPRFATPSEAKAYISGLDFLSAGRMHACIAAFSSGTPVVPMAYSRKFAGLFGLLEYPWLVPVKGVGTEEAVRYVLQAIERRGDLARDMRAGTAKVEGLLDAYRAVLRDVFQRAGARKS